MFTEIKKFYQAIALIVQENQNAAKNQAATLIP